MTAPILEMRGIEKRFPGVIALAGVDLEVGPGEVLALAGENGAGKSTLMKILGGVYQPDGGTIQVEGQARSIRSVTDALALGIGFIHQELNVLDNLDLAENVFLGREPVWAGPLKLVDRKKLHADADIYLCRLGLDLPSRTPLSDLSLAQRQLVEIAKALSLNARIVIMDEPTSSLTLTETDRLLEVIKELRGQGVSVIYISHRLGEIEQIADRVAVLRDGRNAGTLTRGEITHDRIVKLMVGRDLDKFLARPPSREQAPFAAVREFRTVRYPNHPLSIDFRKGEVLGFAGLVGAGRSEFAQALFGVDRKLGGTVAIDGEPIRISAPKDAIARGIFLVPEDRRRCGLILEQSIRENIVLPALDQHSTAGLINQGSERRSATEMSAKLNVKSPSVETAAGSLSGGNQQKVVLAKWLALQPKMMIFDEPTRGIDVGAKAEIYQLMRDLAGAGVAVMMISSDMEEVLGQSDRVAVMHEGAITGILDRDECTEEAVMNLAVGKRGAEGA
jgi:ribose transport system ATP-binding protein